MAIARGLDNDQFKREFFKTYPDFYSGGAPKVDSISGADRRNPQFRQLFDSGNLLPVGEGPSATDLFMERLNAIGAGGLLGKTAKVPQEFVDSFKNFQKELKASRQKLGEFSSGAISGQLLPFSTSPEQRQRLISRAEGEFGRILQGSLEDSFGDLSRRGLLPEGSVGFSGPAAQVLAETRAKTFEDPLTSFIRDLDIQTEADFVSNRNQLRSLGVNVEQFLAGNALDAGNANANFGLGQADLQLQNLNSQRGFAGNLLNLLGQFEGQQFQQDMSEREQRLLAEEIYKSEQEVKRSRRNTFDNFFASPTGQFLGQIGGAAAGSFGGFGGGGSGGALKPVSRAGGSSNFSLPPLSQTQFGVGGTFNKSPFGSYGNLK